MLSNIDMTKSRLVPVQALLLALFALSLSGFAAWLLSHNALGLISGSNTPALWDDVSAVMHEDVDVTGETGVATVAASNDVIGHLEDFSGPNGVPQGAAEFYGNEAQLSFWSPSLSQQWAWVTVRALPLAGLALIWWLLFTVVRSVRRDQGFSVQVANRLRIVGLLVLIGTPLLIVAKWGVAVWLVEDSNASGIADAAPLFVPFWPFALGLVVLVVSSAWRQAAAMRDDLEGLV